VIPGLMLELLAGATYLQRVMNNLHRLRVRKKVT
jgi:hypothetical protein